MNTARGQYDTRQQRAVLRALGDARGFVSARMLHTRLRDAGEHIALTTIYRLLRTFAESGRITVIRNARGAQLFRLAPRPGETHYLVCHTCGDSVPVDAHTVQAWAAATAHGHGFTGIRLVLELTGRCPACQQR